MTWCSLIESVFVARVSRIEVKCFQRLPFHRVKELIYHLIPEGNFDSHVNSSVLGVASPQWIDHRPPVHYKASCGEDFVVIAYQCIGRQSLNGV